MKKIYNTLKKMVLTTATLAFAVNAGFAHFGSKGPYGGTVTCAFSYDTTAVYLGTDDGGVYESINNNLTGWRARPVGLKSGKITSVVHTGSYLFTATADSGVYIFNGYIGSDRYWKKASNGITNMNITSLVAIDSITLLAGTNGGGVFKTTNKGTSWTAVNTGLTNMMVHGFAMAGSRVIQVSDGGVFASDNNGATWFSFNDVNTLGMVSTAVSYNSSTDEVIIANDMGLYRASAASSTMTPAFSAVQTGLPSGVEIRAISNDGATWYIATDSGIYTSASGAISWVTKNNGLLTMDMTAVVPFRANLVAGSNGEGIFQTAATAPSWIQFNNGFNNLETYSVATSGASVVVAATEKGVFVSTNLANTYVRANSGLTDSLHVMDITFMGSKLFAATANDGVFVSADTGMSWTTFNSGLGSNMQMKQIVASMSNIYTYNTNGEIYSSNGTAAWAAIQTGLPGGIVPSSIAFNGTTIILGSLGDGVYTRSESGSTWTAANSGLTDMDVTSVTAAEGKLYAGTMGSGVFVTNAGTIGWTATAPLSISHTVTMNLNGSNVEAMATYGGYVFASYKGGLLITADSGATWEEGGNQFNLPSYTSVHKISFVSTRVFVTTEQNSLYSNALSELDINSTIAASTDAICNGTCNGTATVVATGGTAPYTYLWSNGSTTSSVSNLCAQTYTVTVTDANSATSVKTVVIGQPAALTASFTTTASTTGADGSATVTVSGGDAPYTYAWSNGGTAATITGVGAGDYTVEATDANSCVVIDTVTITGVVGIDDVNGIGSFIVYPNPADDNIVIDLKGLKTEVNTIEVYDVTGKLLYSANKTSIQQQHEIRVVIDFPAGVYYVQLNSVDGVATKKLIVK